MEKEKVWKKQKQKDDTHLQESNWQARVKKTRHGN